MCEHLIICAAEQIRRPFPLTLTLSPRERVKHLQPFVQLSTRFSAARPAILPFHEPPFANGLARILPLPFPRGEGRGEGSLPVGRLGVQSSNLSGNSLPEGEGRSEGEMGKKTRTSRWGTKRPCRRRLPRLRRSR